MIEIKGNYKESTKKIYYDMLDKIGVLNIQDLQDHDLVISRIDALSSDHYKLMAYRAIHSIIGDDLIYNTKYRELHNNIDNNKNILKELPMTLQELKSIEVKCSNALQQLVESFTIWINTYHPLRLDYYNVPINPAEKENHINYMTYYDSVLTFYLNDFKNVQSFGSQVLTYSDPVICSYIAYLSNYFGHLPDFLLYRYDKGKKSLAVFSSRIMYGGYLQDLFKRHTGFDISINTIRKIHESALIQSSEYAKMSFSEKRQKHNLLLHSLQTAHESYNVVTTKD